MALSLRSNDEEDEADEVEQRLRNRLADLEGRLEDQQKIRQMREHIQHMRNKHDLELEKVELRAEQQVEDVKAKARAAIRKAKKQAKRERKRYDAIVAAVEELAEAIGEVEDEREALDDAGLTSRLTIAEPTSDPGEDPRAYMRELGARHRETGDQLTRVREAIGDGELGARATDVDVLEERVQELLTNPEVRSRAMTVAEKARMFAEDPGKSQYYRELIQPYADAIETVADERPRAKVVDGARLALGVLEEAFMDSRTYLLRRSGKLDDHEIETDVVVERIEEDADDAIDRLEAALSTARGLGPVDFFQNLTTEISRRLDRGEDGAGVAAWILSDVTVSILEDEAVRDWLEGQH